MDNIVGGMFSGVSPNTDLALANLQKQREASNIAKTAGLGPYAGLAQIGLSQAQQTGDIVGQALGVEDPTVAKARNKDKAWKEAIDQVQNKSDSEEVYTKLAETFQKYGMTQEALQYGIKAAEAKDAKTKRTREEAKFKREETEAGQKNLKFYKDNPEQTSAELERLAKIIEKDPNNKEALDQYTKIASAGTTGAMEVAAKQEKEKVSLDKDKATINKLKTEMNNPDENRKIEAARQLLVLYNIDKNKPLEGQISTRTLYSTIGPELVKAHELALREKKGGEASIPSAAAPVAADPAIKTAVERAGGVYDPANFDYRIVNGQPQRKPKGK